MPITIESDLKDILNKLDQRFDRMEQRFERMEQNLIDLKVGQTEIKGEVTTLDQKLTGEIRTLDQRLTGEIKTLDQRLTGEIKTLDQRLTGEIKTLDTKVNGINDKIGELQKTEDKISVDVSASRADISDLKGVKALIIPGFVAILASLLTFLFRNISF
jgi:chromosome segregation ATPase